MAEATRLIESAMEAHKDDLKVDLDLFSKAEIPGIMKFSYSQGKDRVEYDGPGLVAYCEHLASGFNRIWMVDQWWRKKHPETSPPVGKINRIDFDEEHFITVKPGSRSFRPTPVKE